MNSYSKRVLVISYHFYPDAAVGAKRPSELALALKANGLEVMALAAKSRRYIRIDSTLIAKAQQLKVEHVIIPPKILDASWGILKKVGQSARRDSPSSEGAACNRSGPETWRNKIKRYVLSIQDSFNGTKIWCLLVCVRLFALRLSRSFDLIISSGPPMSAHVGALMASRLFRAKWIVDLRDPWLIARPVKPAAQSMLRSAIEGKAERACLRHCNLIVCAAPGTKRQITEQYEWTKKKTALAYNGFDDPTSETPSEITGHLSLLYAGTLYYNRNPFPLLEALAEVLGQSDINREKIRFYFVGHCEQWGGINLEAWLKEKNLNDRVEVKPPMSSKELACLTLNSNVLVNFSQGQPNQIPAKTFEHMATGKEVLCIAEEGSDTSVLVQKSGIGRVIDPNNHERMTRTLSELYEYYVVQRKEYAPKPGSSYDRYSRKAQNARYLALIEPLL